MPPATANRLARDIPPLRAPYAPPDEGIAKVLLANAERSGDAEARIDARTRRLVAAIRARAGGLGGIEDFLHAYSLSTKEGLALMVLAEALLRVPDAETADRLIEDKLKAGDWAHQETRSTSLLVSASAWTLGVTARVIHPGETPEGIVETLVKRLGLPPVRAATRQAVRLLGSHFVLGQTIEDALKRVQVLPSRRVIRHWSTGETWNWFDLGATTAQRYGTPHVMLHRGDLHGLLANAVRARKPDAVKLGRRCAAISTDGDHNKEIERTATLTCQQMREGDGKGAETREHAPRDQRNAGCVRSVEAVEQVTGSFLTARTTGRSE
jgi:hypothetical protein